MTCSRCGLHIPEGAQACPNCQAPVRQPGFLKRLLGRLTSALLGAAPRQVMYKTVIKEQRFQVVDETGQRRMYHSLEEVPPELRSKIEEALRAGGPEDEPGAEVRITVKDASGQERTYNSVEEMPPALRAIYERVRENRRP